MSVKTHTWSYGAERTEQPSRYLLGEKAHGKLCALLLTLAAMGRAALQQRRILGQCSRWNTPTSRLTPNTHACILNKMAVDLYAARTDSRTLDKMAGKVRRVLVRVNVAELRKQVETPPWRADLNYHILLCQFAWNNFIETLLVAIYISQMCLFTHFQLWDVWKVSQSISVRLRSGLSIPDFSANPWQIY